MTLNPLAEVAIMSLVIGALEVGAKSCATDWSVTASFLFEASSKEVHLSGCKFAGEPSESERADTFSKLGPLVPWPRREIEMQVSNEVVW